MKRSTGWMSATGWVALGLSLAAQACSGGGGGGAGGTGGASDGGSGQDSTGSAACIANSDCASLLPTTTPPDCATAICDVLQGSCTFQGVDNDNDGDRIAICKANNGVAITVGGDCNDDDPNIYSGHPESCSEYPDGGAATAACAPGKKSCLPDGTESACVGTLVCDNQACVDGQCGGSCQPGQSQCSVTGNGVQTCQSDGSWGSAVACVDQTCIASGPSASCQGDCAPGQPPQCGTGADANYVQTCSAAGTWQDAPTACPSLCTSGACTGSCTPGAMTCNGTTPETCNSSGTWVAGPVTAGTCNAQCTPNATECIGAVPQTCNASGAWAPGAVTAGSCGAVCTPPGQTECVDPYPQTCSATGQWVQGAVVGGECGAQCTPSNTQACNATSGSYTCPTTQSCSGSGTWNACSIAAACPAGWSLSAGNCVTSATATDVMQDSSGDPTASLTPVPNPNISGSVPTGGTVQVTYVSGGCYNLTSTAITVTCAGGTTINIPEDEAGYSGGPAGTVFNVVGAPASCSFQQKEGWTGFNSAICRRQINMVSQFRGAPDGCTP